MKLEPNEAECARGGACASCGRKPATSWSDGRGAASAGPLFYLAGLHRRTRLFLSRPAGAENRGGASATTRSESILDCREFSADVLRRMIADRRNSRREYPRHLGAADGAWRFFLLTDETARHLQLSRSAGERDLQAVSRTSRGPALDDRENGDHAHRRDVLLFRLSGNASSRHATAAERGRWPNVGALRALGITDSITISFHLAFYAGIVVSFPAPPLFRRRICSARADRGGETFPVPGDRGQLRALSDRRAHLLFLALAENDSLFLSRHAIAGLGADVDGAAILLLCDPLHDRLRAGL